jgi:hypothetical protein
MKQRQGKTKAVQQTAVRWFSSTVSFLEEGNNIKEKEVDFILPLFINSF